MGQIFIFSEVIITQLEDILWSCHVSNENLMNLKPQNLFNSIFTSLPNDKIWDQSNLKAFADDILNVVEMMICVTDWVENIVGKG